jgi:xanthine dehydrogenase accessory factor
MHDSLERDLLRAIHEAHAAGRTVALVTVLEASGAHAKLMIEEGAAVRVPDPAPPWFEHAVEAGLSVLASGKISELVAASGPEGALTIAVEVLRPRASLIIFGAGHVGHALALTAALVGYEVTVVDDREQFLTRDRFPDTSIRLIAAPFDRIAKELTISTNTAVVIVTRGHQYDEQCLKDTIDSPAAYLGMIGSKRRVIAVYRRLTERGVDPEKLGRVYAPIGLKIGAVSPQEIAVAILAEIIQTLSVRGSSLGLPGLGSAGSITR